MPATVAATPYGYRTAVSAPFPADEAARWFDEIKRVIGNRTSPFGQLVDLRGQKPHNAEADRIVEEAQSWVRSHGLQRSAVILDSAITKLNILRLSKETGMYSYERYFDASSDPDWERKALDWIERGIDPDQP